MARRKGFTLIELLVVIGILAILLTIVLIAINPARQFNLSNDTKRRSEVLAVLNAVHQFAADPANRGSMAALAIPVVDLAATPPVLPVEISTLGVELCTELVPTYISALPVDPDNLTYSGTTPETTDPVVTCATAYDTGYYIGADAQGRVTVYAPHTSTASNPAGDVAAYDDTDIRITR